CRRAIHLQCAGGRDTLSLWNLGAEEVVGVDFSPRMLDLAARLSKAVGAPAEWLFDVDADGGWVATDYDYFAGPEASKGWAPEYIDRLSLDDDHQSWKFARAWTLGEIVTAILGSGLTVERVAEHPTDWWNGHADVRADERGRIPLSF